MIKLMSLKYMGAGNTVILEYGEEKRICINSICNDEVPEIQRVMPKLLRQVTNTSYRNVIFYLKVGNTGGAITLEVSKEYSRWRINELVITGTVGLTVLFQVRVRAGEDRIDILREVMNDKPTYNQVINNPVIKHLITTTIMEMMR